MPLVERANTLPKRGWYAGRHQVNVWLTDDEFSDLERARTHTGLTAAGLFRAFLREKAHERLPESQGRVRVELDPDEDAPHIERLMVLAETKADGAGRAVRAATDPVRRTGWRNERRDASDDAAWCEDLLDKLRQRKQVLEAGLRDPRHRYVAGVPNQPASSASSAQGEPLSAV